MYLVGGSSPVGDFSQTVTLGEWLVRHVLELGRDSVRAPTIFIVLKKKAKMIKNYGTAYVYHGVIFVPDHEVSNKFWLHIITYLTLEVFQTEGKTKSEFGF